MWMLLFFNYERQTVGFGLCLRDEFVYILSNQSLFFCCWYISACKGKSFSLFGGYQLGQ